MPIVQPLLMIGGSIFSDGGAIVAQETDIARATELPLQLLSSSPPSPQLLTLLQQTGYIYPIISLHSYLATKALSSGLMASCRDVCKFLMERDPAIPGIAGDLIRAMLFEPPRKFCLGNSGGIEIREKGAKSDDDGYTMLLGGIKSQLSSLLPASASDITKESFEQMLSLCMEQSDQSFAVNELSGDRYKNVNSFKSSSISRALEIAHSFELISSCSKDQGGTADASGNAISSLLSDIFLQSMAGYFDFKSNESDCASGAASSSSAVGGVSTSVDREQHGIILLALQSTLPTTLLLADGIKIIQLLKLVIEVNCFHFYIMAALNFF